MLFFILMYIYLITCCEEQVVINYYDCVTIVLFYNFLLTVRYIFDQRCIQLITEPNNCLHCPLEIVSALIECVFSLNKPLVFVIGSSCAMFLP